MAVSFRCDICDVHLVNAGCSGYGVIEGYGIRSVGVQKGWETCDLSGSEKHLCVVCGKGIAKAFARL